MEEGQEGDSTSRTITQEEFFSFHNIDRQLFSRLVFHMRREPSEALQVTAFWLWLERLEKAQFVVTILNFSDNLFMVFLEETLLCLKATESVFRLTCLDDIPMVRSIIGKTKDQVNLKGIHENRVSVLLGIGYFVKKVCLNAFQDLIQLASENRSFVPINRTQQPNRSSFSLFHVSPKVSVNRIIGRNVEGLSSILNQSRLPPNNEENFRDSRDVVVNYPSLQVGDFSVPLRRDHFNVSNGNYSLKVNGASSSNYDPSIQANNNNYGLGTQPQTLQRNAVDQLYVQMQLSENSHQFQRFEEKPNSHPTERTVFLTFSKGYPILENELREFLNRNFGDIIEALYMQEVGENEQPLYARLVVRDERLMALVLSEHGRSKFSINGRHVWARKYVRKSSHSPPSSPPKMANKFSFFQYSK